MPSLKLSIREVLLIVLGVCLFLAWRQAASRHSAQQLEIQELRFNAGYIRIESDDVIYVRQRDSERSSQWRFRIYVPEGANYQYAWSYDLGGVELAGDYPIACTEEKQRDIVVYTDTTLDSFGLTICFIHCTGNSSAACDVVIDEQMMRALRDYNYSDFNDGFLSTYRYDSGLHQFSLGETINLLRLQGKHPDTGKDIWIELNLEPQAGNLNQSSPSSSSSSP